MWKFEVFKSEDRCWCWRLVQCNTLIVVESSAIYGRRSDAKLAAEAARLEIGNAPIDAL